MQIWGIPDFIHVRWDARAAFGGDLDRDSDTIVFAQGTIDSVPDMVHTVDDSQMSAEGRWHFRPLTGSVPW
jgi:hypothetical protein